MEKHRKCYIANGFKNQGNNELLNGDLSQIKSQIGQKRKVQR